MTRPQDRFLPAVVHAPHDNGPRERAAGRAARNARPENPFAAHLLGQDGQKRGLRGGAPVLDRARAAYLGAEYSGENDRRPPSGLIVRKAI
jgi:hypothetical protein